MINLNIEAPHFYKCEDCGEFEYSQTALRCSCGGPVVHGMTNTDTDTHTTVHCCGAPATRIR